RGNSMTKILTIEREYGSGADELCLRSKDCPQGTHPTIAELANRLVLRYHTTVELIIGRNAHAPTMLLHLVLFLMRLGARLQEFYRLARTAGARHLEFLAALLVVGNEKLLQLIEKRLAHILDGFQVLMVVGVDSDAQKPVIAF